MKNIFTLIVIAYSFATLGAEDDGKKSTESYLQSTLSKTSPLKRLTILKPPADRATKRSKKVVAFDLESQSLPIPPLPDNKIDIHNIHLERLTKSCEYRSLTRFIYDDCEKLGIRQIVGITRKEALELIEKMRLTREYAQETDFGNYIIRHALGNEIIGRMMFTNFIHERVPDKGFLEIQFHLLSEYRGRGIGAEVLGRIMNVLIASRIGKVCSFMRSVLTHEPQDEEVGAPLFRSTLMGVYGKSSLINSHILDNYGKIAAYYKAGFGVKLWNGDVIMSFPPGCFPAGSSLERSEVAAIVLISKLMQDCREIKKQRQNPVNQQSDIIPEEPVIELKEIVQNPQIYENKIADLRKQYRKLLVVTEPFTFLSALNILHGEFNMTKEELGSDVSSEKATSMCLILDKERKVPNGFNFLKTFIPFRLHLSYSDEPDA
jgi:hypothetical protein